MQNAYDRLQKQVMAAGNYADLALAAPAERLGRCGDDKLQRASPKRLKESTGRWCLPSNFARALNLIFPPRRR